MQPAIGVSAVSWADSLAGVHTRQEAAVLASSGERLLGQAPAGKSVLEVAGGADDVFPVDGGGHELRAVEPPSTPPAPHRARGIERAQERLPDP